MPQPLAGTIGSIFNGKGKTAKRRLRKPGPEWSWPLSQSAMQIVIAGSYMFIEGKEAFAEGNPFRFSNALYNGYLLVKGLHNFNITLRSANEAPLRELLADKAPANDNLLTPRQSLSNSYALTSRTFGAFAATTFLNTPYEAGTYGSGAVALVSAAVSTVFSTASALGFKFLSHRTCPTRMPSVTGKLPPAP